MRSSTSTACRYGVANARLRAALGPLGRPLFGTRTLRPGDFGWDVSVLQFLLTRRGVYTGALDGYLGKETTAALQRYQRAMHLLARRGRRARARSRRSCVATRVPVRAHGRVRQRPTLHIVRAGDTLTALAARFHTTIAALASRQPHRSGEADRDRPAPAAADGGARARRRSEGRRALDARHLVGTPRRRPAPRARARLDGVGLPDARSCRPPELAACSRRCRRRARTSRPCSPGGRCRTPSTVTSRSACSTSGTCCRRSTATSVSRSPAGTRASGPCKKHGLYKVTKPFVANVLALRTRM